jgi:hypothetical protein
MKRIVIAVILIAMLAGVVLVGAVLAQPPGHATFVAPMSGDQEVADPPVETNARGQAVFQLSKDGTELSYRLIVANLHNVTMAHIHCGAAGVNGPVVAWLYPDAPPPQLIPGRSSGVLAQGVIDSSSVVIQPDSAACPGGVANFDELLAKMNSGETYVNVHTEQYPAGEVRGQIRRTGPPAN